MIAARLAREVARRNGQCEGALCRQGEQMELRSSLVSGGASGADMEGDWLSLCCKVLKWRE